MTAFFDALIRRRVFANVLMGVFIVGGLIAANSIRQELMPGMEARFVEVEVELEGATPEEVSTSVLAVVENGVRGLDGVKRVDARAWEGGGSVTLTLLKGAEAQQVLADVKTAVDRITTLPAEAERPTVTLPSEVEKALSIVVYGDQPLMWLRQTAEAVRDDLRTRAGLTRVQLAFPREQEVSVEISEDALRQYGLTLADVAARIRENALNLSGGTLYARQADIALRTTERKVWASEYTDVVVAESADGIPVRLADMAVLRDGFGQAPIETWFNGLPAVQIDLFAVGDETPAFVEETVQAYLETVAGKKYPGVAMTIFENEAAAYRSRMALLVENALLGLLLVLVILGLFLSPHLAFWVMVGIPTSLLGGLLLLPLFNGTLNMLSMFAFIVTIGVVVDDAIMVGEAIHVQRTKGLAPLDAAVAGLKNMGGPVLLATCTTIIAFMPMFFVPGEMGVLFHQIPAVVVAVLVVSLVESLFILAVHLAKDHPETPWLERLARPQRAVNARLQDFIRGPFRTFLCHCLIRPMVLLAAGLALLLISIGAVAAGLLDFDFVPTIEADTVMAQATLPYGSPRSQSVAVQQKLVERANRVLAAHEMVSPGVLSLIGTRLEEGEVEVETMAGSHYVSVLVAMPPKESRTISGREFALAWQQAFGDAGRLEALSFTGEKKVTGGEPICLEVFHPEEAVAKAAALSLGESLRRLPGLFAIDDGIRAGKPELVITLKSTGLRMGLTAGEVARQVRHRYHGAEALRLVRDGNEVKVMVRLDEQGRQHPGALETLLLRCPNESLVPLCEVADIARSRAFTGLARRDGRRIFPITADMPFGLDDDLIEDVLEEKILPALARSFPGVRVAFAGEEEEADEALGALGYGFLVALGAMFLLLTGHYNTVREPLLILSVIPFSFIGAVWGHILLGYDLSIVSVIGIIAMTGVVVNDSLVLVTTYRRHCMAGRDRSEAIVDAACQRFRPILLTSLTTFGGLAPLLLERSEQAQFLIPAAISIAFGLAFGTVITLVLVPGLLHLAGTGGETTEHTKYIKKRAAGWL